MTAHQSIPVFNLFGETAAFPDVVHSERIVDRAPEHGWRIAPHRHGHMSQVFLLRGGVAEAQVDGVNAALPPGHVLFVPPRVVHGFVFSPGTDGLVLSFPTPVVDSLGPASTDLSERLARPQLLPATPEIADLSDRFADRFDRPGAGRAPILVGLAHALLAAIAEAAAPEPARPQANLRMRAALDRLIAAHLSDGWRPADYASALSITTGQLSRICRAATGQGAQAYIDAAVMSEACRMLAFTQMPVAEIGYRLGYGDPSYFSRAFRRAQGETPSDYRARFAQ